MELHQFRLCCFTFVWNSNGFACVALALATCRNCDGFACPALTFARNYVGLGCAALTFARNYNGFACAALTFARNCISVACLASTFARNYNRFCMHCLHTQINLQVCIVSHYAFIKINGIDKWIDT